MVRHHRLRFGAVLVALVLIAAACGDDDSGGSASGDGQGAITIALGSEPTTLDPQVRDDGGERAINDNIYDTLLKRDAKGELQPSVASEMPTQVDDTHWSVKIRDGISFTNGEALDAAAVAASWTRILDPALKSEQSSFTEGITKAEAQDDGTVLFTTDGFDPVFASQLYWIKLVPPKYSSDSAFAEKPVGSGPYQLTEWVRGDHIVLETNPDYWGDEKPSIGKVTYKFVSEGGTRLSGLKSGEFDLITNLLPEDVSQAPNSAHVRGLEHPVMILNSFDGVTSDVRVRQAMNYAIDKQALADNLFGGFAAVDDCQILSPSFFGYNPDLKPYAYDLEKAKSLIADAGAEGAQIDIVGEAGRWLKDREVIEAVANYWSEAGLKPNVQIFEFDEYLNRLFDRDTRAPAIFVSSSNELLDASRQLSAFYAIDGNGASNKDEEMDSLITQARTETDEGKRESLYQDAVKRACDNAYFAFLLNNEDIYGMSKRLDWTPRVDAKLILSEMKLA